MDRYQQIKSDFIDSSRVGDRTRQFINKADNRSLQGSIYSFNEDVIKTLPGLTRANSIVLNTGGIMSNIREEASYMPLEGGSNFDEKGLEDLREYKKYKERVTFIKGLERRGVDVNSYGDPFGRDNIHTKLYTGTFDGEERALVSTGNLSSSAMKGLESTNENTENFFQRRRKYEGTIDRSNFNQYNIAVEYKDERVVKEVKNFIGEVRSGIKPTQGNYLKTGQAAINEIIKRIEVSKKGDTVTLTSAYIDDSRVASALVQAKNKGADVELITHGGEGGSRRKEVILSRLKASNIRILDDGDRGLLHAKTFAVKRKDGTYESAIGSSNLTGASAGSPMAYRHTLDAMVFSQGGEGSTSEDIFRETHSSRLKRKVTLYRSPVKKTEKYGKVERKLLSKGLSTYRVGASKNGKPPNMTYHPTSMDSKFFAHYKGQPLPTYLKPYQTLYESRTGREANWAIKKMDRALMTPGIGGRINHTVGWEVYRENKGIIGSAFYSTGASLDMLFGYEKYKEEKAIKSGQRQGSLKKFFTFLNKEEKDSQGVFEWALGTSIDMVRNLSEAIGTYILINLPLQHIKAELSSKWMKDLLIADPFKADDTLMSKIRKKGSRLLRNVAFGSEYGTILSDSIERVETMKFNDPNSRPNVPEEVAKELSNIRSNLGQNPKGILNQTFTQDGNLRGIISWNRAGGFITSTMSAFRNFEKARYEDILKPILHAINPYAYNSDNYNQFIKVVDEVGDTIGEAPRIVYQGTGGVTPSRLELQNVGSERINRLYGAFDKLGAVLPLNPTYWFPAFRKVMGLPEFDPSKNMTWNRAWPLEASSRLAQNSLSFLKSSLSQPFTIFNRARKAWQINIEMNQALSFLKSNQSSSIKSVDNFIKTVDPTTINDNAKLKLEIQNLMQSTQLSYEEASRQVMSLYNSSAYQDYSDASERLHKQYQTLISPFEKNTMGAEPYSEHVLRGSSVTNNVETFKKGRRIRSTLLATGALLLLDNIIERSLVGSSPSIITQLLAAFSLNDPSDGSKVARFEFEGTAPNAAVISSIAAGYVGGGLLFPEYVETGNRVIDTSSHRGFINKVDTEFSKLISGRSLIPSYDTTGVMKASSEYKANVDNIKTHRSLRFSRGNAAITALMLGLSTQVLSSAAAASANILFNTGGPLEAMGRAVGSLFGFDNKEQGLKLESNKAILSMILETALSKKIDNSEGGSKDLKQITMAKILLEHTLTEDREVSKVYSIATQLPIPFFQVSAVGKSNSLKDTIDLSIGMQFTPTAGLGINPILPISLRTKTRDFTKEELLYLRRAQSEKNNDIVKPLSSSEKFQLKSLDILNIISGTNPNFLGVQGNADSGFLNIMDFVGVATLGSGALNLYQGSKVDYKVQGFLNKQNWYKRELASLKKELGPLGRGITSYYGVGSNTMSNLLTLPINFIRTIPRAVKEFISREAQYPNEPPKTDAEKAMEDAKKPFNSFRKTTSRVISSRAFKTALVTFAVTRLVTAWASPGGGSNTSFNDPLERFQAILGATSILSFGFLSSGVFASQEQMAAKFIIGNNVKNKRAELERILPQGAKSRDAKNTIGYVVEAGANMAAPSNVSSRIWNPVRRLQADIASPYLINESWKASGVDKTSIPRVNNLRSVSGRFALASGIFFGTKIAAHGILSTLPKDIGDSLLNTPLIGPTIQFFTGNRLKEDLFHQYREKPDHYAVKALSFISRTVTMGLFDLAKFSQMYTDKSDPYISTFGPFGQSEKGGDLNSYAQFSGDISDVSASSYHMMKYGLNRLLREEDIVSSLRPDDNLNMVINKIMAQQYRNKAMSVSSLRNTTKEAASRLISRAMAIQTFQMQHLAHQTVLGLAVSELSILGASGHLGEASSKEGKVDTLWSLDDKFSSYEHKIGQYGSTLTNSSIRQMFMGTVQGFQFANTKKNGFDIVSPLFGIKSEDLDLPEPFSKIASLILSFASLIPLGLATLGVLTSGATTIGALGRKNSYQELLELAEKSDFYRQRGIVQPQRYQFIEVKGNDGKTKIVQIDSRSGTTVGTLLPITNADDLVSNTPSKATGSPRTGAFIVRRSYREWATTVNDFFSKNISNSLTSVINSKINSNGSVDWSTIKTDLRSKHNVLQSVLDTSLTTKGDTIFSLFFKNSTSTSSDQFLQGIFNEGGLLDDLIDEAEKIWNDKLIGDISVKEAKIRLFAELEKSAAYRLLQHRLTTPSTASYETGMDATKEQVQKIQRVNGTLKAVEVPLKLRSQTITENLLAGSKGGAKLLGDWLTFGKSGYEIFEGLSVSQDRRKTLALRRSGAKRAAMSTLYEGISIGAMLGIQAITKKLTFLPTVLSGFLSVAGGIFIEFNIGSWISKNNFLSESEDKLYEFSADVLTRPRRSLENTATSLGFKQNTAKDIGHISEVLFKPVQWLIEGVSKLSTTVLENTVVPLLIDQWESMETDSTAMQLFKSLFIPRTSYYNYQMGAVKRQALQRYKRAMKVNRSLSTDFVSPLVLGSIMDYREYEMSNKYFQGSGRLLTREFGAQNYRPSNLLILAMQRQQGLYDQEVIGSSTMRMLPQYQQYDFTRIGVITSGIGMGLISLMFNKRQGIRHLITSSNSNIVRKAALEEISELRKKLGISDDVKINFNNKRRFGMEGWYSKSYSKGSSFAGRPTLFYRHQTITLSSSVENIMGRGRLGGFLESPGRKAFLQSRFITLHEMAHSLQLSDQLSTQLSNSSKLTSASQFDDFLKNLGLNSKQINRVIQTAEDLALESAQRFARENNITQAEFNDVYLKELEANRTAFANVSTNTDSRRVGKDVSLLERRVRLSNRRSSALKSSTNNFVYDPSVQRSTTYDYSNKRLYRSSAKTFSTERLVYKTGLQYISNIPSNILNKIKLFASPLADVEQANVDEFLDSIFTFNKNKNLGQLFKTYFKGSNEFLSTSSFSSALITARKFKRSFNKIGDISLQSYYVNSPFEYLNKVLLDPPLEINETSIKGNKSFSQYQGIDQNSSTDLTNFKNKGKFKSLVSKSDNLLSSILFKYSHYLEDGIFEGSDNSKIISLKNSYINLSSDLEGFESVKNSRLGFIFKKFQNISDITLDLQITDNKLVARQVFDYLHNNRSKSGMYRYFNSLNDLENMSAQQLEDFTAFLLEESGFKGKYGTSNKNIKYISKVFYSIFEESRINAEFHTHNQNQIEVLKKQVSIKQDSVKNIVHNFLDDIVEHFEARDKIDGGNSAQKIKTVFENRLSNFLKQGQITESKFLTGTISQIITEATKADAKYIKKGMSKYILDNLDVLIEGVANNLKGAIKGTGAVGFELLKRAGKLAAKPFQPILKPTLGVISNLAERFKRFNIGIGDIFQTLDVAFTILDTKYGYDTIQFTNKLTAHSSTEDFIRSAEDRLGAKASTFGGVGISFITGNIALALGVGLIALTGTAGLRLGLQMDSNEKLKDYTQQSTLGKLLLNTSKGTARFISSFMKLVFKKDVNEKTLRNGILYGDWGGFAKNLAEREQARAKKGEAIYTDYASASVYVAVHKPMETSARATRQFIGTALNDNIIKPVKKALGAVYNVISSAVKPVVKWIVKTLLPIAIPLITNLTILANELSVFAARAAKFVAINFKKSVTKVRNFGTSIYKTVKNFSTGIYKTAKNFSTGMYNRSSKFFTNRIVKPVSTYMTKFPMRTSILGHGALTLGLFSLAFFSQKALGLDKETKQVYQKLKEKNNIIVKNKKQLEKLEAKTNLTEEQKELKKELKEKVSKGLTEEEKKLLAELERKKKIESIVTTSIIGAGSISGGFMTYPLIKTYHKDILNFLKTHNKSIRNIGLPMLLYGAALYKSFTIFDKKQKQEQDLSNKELAFRIASFFGLAYLGQITNTLLQSKETRQTISNFVKNKSQATLNFTKTNLGRLTNFTKTNLGRLTNFTINNLKILRYSSGLLALDHILRSEDINTNNKFLASSLVIASSFPSYNNYKSSFNYLRKNVNMVARIGLLRGPGLIGIERVVTNENLSLWQKAYMSTGFGTVALAPEVYKLAQVGKNVLKRFGINKELIKTAFSWIAKNKTSITKVVKGISSIGLIAASGYAISRIWSKDKQEHSRLQKALMTSGVVAMTAFSNGIIFPETYKNRFKWATSIGKWGLSQLSNGLSGVLGFLYKQFTNNTALRWSAMAARGFVAAYYTSHTIFNRDDLDFWDKAVHSSLAAITATSPEIISNIHTNVIKKRRKIAGAISKFFKGISKFTIQKTEELFNFVGNFLSNNSKAVRVGLNLMSIGAASAYSAYILSKEDKKDWKTWTKIAGSYALAASPELINTSYKHRDNIKNFIKGGSSLVSNSMSLKRFAVPRLGLAGATLYYTINNKETNRKQKAYTSLGISAFILSPEIYSQGNRLRKTIQRIGLAKTYSRAQITLGFAQAASYIAFFTYYGFKDEKTYSDKQFIKDFAKAHTATALAAISYTSAQIYKNRKPIRNFISALGNIATNKTLLGISSVAVRYGLGLYIANSIKQDEESGTLEKTLKIMGTGLFAGSIDIYKLFKDKPFIDFSKISKGIKNNFRRAKVIAKGRSRQLANLLIKNKGIRSRALLYTLFTGYNLANEDIGMKEQAITTVLAGSPEILSLGNQALRSNKSKAIVNWLTTPSKSRARTRRVGGTIGSIGLLLSSVDWEEKKLDDGWEGLAKLFGGVALLGATYTPEINNGVTKRLLKWTGLLAKSGATSPLSQLANRTLFKGVWGSLLDLAAPMLNAIAIGGSLYSSVHNLGKKSSTRADYERESVLLAKSLGSLEGSIFGQLLGGDTAAALGEVITPLLIKPDQEKVDQWYEARSSGWVVAGHQTRHSGRRIKIAAGAARALNKLANTKGAEWLNKRAYRAAIRKIALGNYKKGTEAGRYLVSIGTASYEDILNAKKIYKTTNKKGFIRGIGRAIENAIGSGVWGFRAAREEAALRMIRRLDAVEGTNEAAKYVGETGEMIRAGGKAQKAVDLYSSRMSKQGTGILADIFTQGFRAQKLAKKAAPLLRITGRLLNPLSYISDIIDVGLGATAIKSLWENDDWNDWEDGSYSKRKARYIENYARATGSAYSISGSFVGNAIGGPAGGVVGAGLAIGGQILGDKVGKKIATRAFENDVSSKQLVKDSAIGAGAGIAVGLGAAAVVIATGGLALIPSLLVLLGGGSVGAASGWTAGGYISSGRGSNRRAKSSPSNILIALASGLTGGGHMLSGLGSKSSPSNITSKNGDTIENRRRKYTKKNKDIAKQVDKDFLKGDKEYKGRGNRSIDNVDVGKFRQSVALNFKRRLNTVTNYLFGYSYYDDIKNKQGENVAEDKEAKSPKDKGIFHKAWEAIVWGVKALSKPIVEGLDYFRRTIVSLTSSFATGVDRATQGAFAMFDKFRRHSAKALGIGGNNKDFSTSGSYVGLGGTPIVRPSGISFAGNGSKASVPWYQKQLNDRGYPQLNVTDGPGMRPDRPHYGVDISTGMGTQLYTPFNSAKVIASTTGKNAGNYVTLAQLDRQGNPTGRRITIMHLNNRSVKVGDILSGGDKIGTEGSTGRSTGSHAHIEEKNKKSDGSFQRVLPDVNSIVAIYNREEPIKLGKKGGNDHMKPFYEFLFKYEGSTYEAYNRGRGGDSGGTSFEKRYGKKLTNLTVGEIRKLQKNGNLFAVGFLQIIPKTLQGQIDKGVIKSSDKFTPELQYKLADSLFNARVGSYITDKDNENIHEAMLQISMEWSVAPNPRTGASYYGDKGEKAKASIEEVQNILKEVKRLYHNPKPKTEKEKQQEESSQSSSIDATTETSNAKKVFAKAYNLNSVAVNSPEGEIIKGVKDNIHTHIGYSTSAILVDAVIEAVRLGDLTLTERLTSSPKYNVKELISNVLSSEDSESYGLLLNHLYFANSENRDNKELRGAKKYLKSLGYGSSAVIQTKDIFYDDKKGKRAVRTEITSFATLQAINKAVSSIYEKGSNGGYGYGARAAMLALNRRSTFDTSTEVDFQIIFDNNNHFTLRLNSGKVLTIGSDADAKVNLIDIVRQLDKQDSEFFKYFSLDKNLKTQHANKIENNKNSPPPHTTALFTLPNQDATISEDVIALQAEQQFEDSNRVISLAKGSLQAAADEVEKLDKLRRPEVIKVSDLKQSPDLFASSSDPYINTKPVTEKNATISEEEQVDLSLKTLVTLDFNGEDYQQNFEYSDVLAFSDNNQFSDVAFDQSLSEEINS